MKPSRIQIIVEYCHLVNPSMNSYKERPKRGKYCLSHATFAWSEKIEKPNGYDE